MHLYSILYSKNGHGPRSQFGPRSIPDVCECSNRVLWVLAPCGNTQTALGISWDRTIYVVHWQCLLYKSYTTYTPRLAAPAELYSYTVLYSAIQYTAIQRYTLYNLCNTPLLSKEVHHSHHMLLVTSITSSNDERGIGGRSCLRPLVRLLEVVRGGELSQPSHARPRLF